MGTKAQHAHCEGAVAMKKATSIGLLFAACALITLALYASTPDGEAALETAKTGEAPTRAQLMAKWKAKMRSLMPSKKTQEPSTELTSVSEGFNAKKLLNGIFSESQKAAAKKEGGREEEEGCQEEEEGCQEEEGFQEEEGCQEECGKVVAQQAVESHLEEIPKSLQEAEETKEGHEENEAPLPRQGGQAE